MAHFSLDQIDSECLDLRGFFGFDVDDFQQCGQVIFARLQGVGPARAASYLGDHDLYPVRSLKSPIARALSGVAAVTTRGRPVRCICRNAPTNHC